MAKNNNSQASQLCSALFQTLQISRSFKLDMATQNQAMQYCILVKKSFLILVNIIENL